MGENNKVPKEKIIGHMNTFKSEEESWSSYIERFECFIVRNGIPNDKKVPTLLIMIGTNAYELLRNLCAPNKPFEKTFEELVKLMENRPDEKTSCRAERLKFHRRTQTAGESIPQYLEALKKIAMHCDFENLNDRLYDKLVWGIKDKSIGEKIMSNDTWTYELAVEVATKLESARTKPMYSNQDKTDNRTRAQMFATESSRKPSEECSHCGYRNHESQKCHYRDTICYICGEIGHLGKICKTKKNRRNLDRNTSTNVNDEKKQNYITREERMANMRMEEGKTFYERKMYEFALNSYSKAIEWCPHIAKYYNNRAACYMMLDKYSNALTDAKKSFEVDPTFAKGYIRAVRCCIKIGNITEAETILNKLNQIDATQAEITITERQNLMQLQEYNKKADVAYKLKDYHTVIYYMDCCCKISVNGTHFKLMRAECLAYLEKYEEARKIANSILRIDSSNIDAMYVCGICLYYQDSQLGNSYIKQVLRLASDHVKALKFSEKATLLKQKKEAGNMAFKAGHYQESYNLYTEALAVDPKNKSTNAKLHFNKALCATKMGKLSESVSECSEALNLDENYLKAILERGTCYLKLEEYEKAIHDFQRALEIDNNELTRRWLQEAKDALQQSTKKNYYKLLGIERNASIHEIKAAYKKKALIHHPDKHSHATDSIRKLHENIFKRIGEAYSILSDPQKRLRYDLTTKYEL